MNAYRDQYAKLFNNGQNVVLIGISADPVDALASWARDNQFQFLMASDVDAKIGKLYGAIARNPAQTNRNLFVVGPDGKIIYRAVPFREIDPTSYTALGDIVKTSLPADTVN